MAAGNGFHVHRRIGIALSVLSDAERKAVQAVLGSRQSFERNLKDRARVHRLPSSEELCLLDVTPDLRLVFRQAESQIEVLDLVGQETLDWFAAQRAGEPRRLADNGENRESSRVARKNRSGIRVSS